jgi:hypothetical protein
LSWGFLWIVTIHFQEGGPLVDEYDGRQYVGIDLHRRRSVIVRMTPEGQRLGPAVRIDNDPFTLAQQVASWGESQGLGKVPECRVTGL